MLDRVKWIIKDRQILKKKLTGFNIHWSAFSDPESNFSEYNNIGKRCLIFNSSLGRLTYVGAGTKIIRAEIGSFCSIAQEALIGGLASHPTDWLSTHPVFYSTKKQANLSFAKRDDIEEENRVVIGHDVWIGARAMILDGCNIGNGAVIAAGAVVVKDIPPYAIAGGVPAKVLKYRFPPDKISHIEKMEWWSMSLEDLSKLDARPSAIQI